MNYTEFNNNREARDETADVIQAYLDDVSDPDEIEELSQLTDALLSDRPLTPEEFKAAESFIDDDSK